MIDAPYKVLGVSQNATQEEIKKAYRQMTKKYHPGLHPDGPNANKRMNEINEAYDMLMNPGKYAAKRAQQQQSQSRQQGGSYGQQYGQSGQRQDYDPYRGPGGWASDFDFGDIFGFDFGDTQRASTRPQPQPGDSPEVQRVVSAINSGRCQEMVNHPDPYPQRGQRRPLVLPKRPGESRTGQQCPDGGPHAESGSDGAEQPHLRPALTAVQTSRTYL